MRVYYLVVRRGDGHIMEVLCPLGGFSVIPLPPIFKYQYILPDFVLQKGKM
jgi:hypothetical protein